MKLKWVHFQHDQDVALVTPKVSSLLLRLHFSFSLILPNRVIAANNEKTNCSLFCLFFDCFFDMFVDCCRVCLQHPNLFCAFFHSQRPYWTIEVTFYNKRKTQRKETKFNENMFETSQKFIEYRTEFYCWIWKFRAIYWTSKWQSLSSLVRYHQHTNTFMQQQKKPVRETQKCTPTLSLEMRAKKLWKKVLDMEHHIGRIGEAL